LPYFSKTIVWPLASGRHAKTCHNQFQAPAHGKDRLTLSMEIPAMSTQQRQMTLTLAALAVLLSASLPTTAHEMRHGAVRDSAAGLYLWQGQSKETPHVAHPNSRPIVSTAHPESHHNNFNANRVGYFNNYRLGTGYGLHDGWNRGYGYWGSGGWGYGGWGYGDSWPAYDAAAAGDGQVIPAAMYQSQYPPSGGPAGGTWTSPAVAPLPKVGPSPAVVQIFVIDPNAELWLNGVKVQQTGQMRNFRTPELEPGKTYKYEVRAKWTQDGKPFEQTRTVTVQAGQQVGLNIFGRSSEDLPPPAIKK
jgi:uncharacterized protein (TIGR03000 family)